MIEIALDIEIHEEANINANIVGRKFLGLIYIEDGNSVNAVHVGLAYLYDLDSENVTIKEKDILEDLGFVSIDYLKEHFEELTYWSQLIIPYLQEV
jgi:predicted NUDIX family phosphoesterase